MDLESICDELFEDPQCIPDDIRDRIMMVCHGHGSTEVRFIGSLAQAEGGMKSYIELLVEMEEGRTLLDLVAIKQDLEDMLGRKVNVLTTNSISPHIRQDLLSVTYEL